MRPMVCSVLSGQKLPEYVHPCGQSTHNERVLSRVRHNNGGLRLFSHERRWLGCWRRQEDRESVPVRESSLLTWCAGVRVTAVARVRRFSLIHLLPFAFAWPMSGCCLRSAWVLLVAWIGGWVGGGPWATTNEHGCLRDSSAFRFPSSLCALLDRSSGVSLSTATETGLTQKNLCILCLDTTNTERVPARPFFDKGAGPLPRVPLVRVEGRPPLPPWDFSHHPPSHSGDGTSTSRQKGKPVDSVSIRPRGNCA